MPDGTVSNRKGSRPIESVAFELGQLRGEVGGLQNTLSNVEKLLIGDPGILIHLTQLESASTHLTTLVSEIKPVLSTMSKDIDCVKKDVTAHMADKDLHSWRVVFKRSVIGSLIGMIILIVLLMEYVPDWVMKILALFGL